MRKLFSQHIQKWVNPSRLSENWTTIYIIIQKLSRLSWNFPDCPKPFLTFSTVRKLSKQSKKFPDCPEVFQTFQKLSGLNRLSRNFPDYAETFQTVRNLSRLMLCFDLFLGNFFVDTRKNFPETQKFSGRQCRQADGVFLPLGFIWTSKRLVYMLVI